MNHPLREVEKKVSAVWLVLGINKEETHRPTVLCQPNKCHTFLKSMLLRSSDRSLERRVKSVATKKKKLKK